MVEILEMLNMLEMVTISSALRGGYCVLRASNVFSRLDRGPSRVGMGEMLEMLKMLKMVTILSAIRRVICLGRGQIRL